MVRAAPVAWVVSVASADRASDGGGGPTALPWSAAAERNQAPILAVLQRELGTGGRALEIAAGTGQHAVHFATALPGWQWQPTEADTAALPALTSRVANTPGIATPRQLDVTALPWALTGPFELVYAANLLHIAPVDCVAALMKGSAAVLTADGCLITYGPYRIAGEPFADSNRLFDESLRRRDPRWGIRDLAGVEAAAEAAGLRLSRREAMPANNQVLIFRRQ